MAGLIPAIHVSAALDQVVDARVKPGYDESWAEWRYDRAKAPYSAGLAGVDTSVPVVACEAAAALFSTIPTAMIEPS
ncbi:hypothetical protein BwSH20_11110 [Bradyrhizobium ottawaense]|nr:hypothetical protein SG09_58310 [Bradyrhizobium ottawaense]BBO12379.1 hypothetical protein TM102_38490 [Bradyrhizobium sp. TM102]GMO28963.1 hypothetical protein BwSF21_29300 [Bradyrhizobium ottawaense]GMO38002.1 hypothetical protein BwSH14_46380 [Bradyrhizobium ottawaense]GMO44180.1 hypothetical protein BwSF12_48620 [Bradyrhizobium ottawaense]